MTPAETVTATAEQFARRRVRKVPNIGWTFLCCACRHGHRCASHREAISRAAAHTCHDHDATGACLLPPGGDA